MLVHWALDPNISPTDVRQVPVQVIFVTWNIPSLKQKESVSLVAVFSDNLADYKRLRGVKFMTEFPLATIGKVVRRHVRDMVLAELKQNQTSAQK